MKELPKAYNPAESEDKIYRLWEESGFFNPDNLPDAESREPFTIVLPPPNVTGTLHIGHAYEDTIQDVLVRFARMNGKRALWVPGTDHAAIATQAKVEKKIYEEEGKSRHDLGREEFLKRVMDFALDSQNTILGQLRKLGLSLDWSRLAFTLDAKRGEAVFAAFKTMYDLGLIYRGYRVVNWDPRGQTTVSDDEVVYKENKGKLYYFRYDKNFPFAIATTRPETKLGDTAVAVNPNDKRYQQYIGQTIKANFAGVELELKIVADEDIDPEYGTGAVGVTPAHSMVDWELSQRHDLPLKQVIDERARITNTNTPFDGKKILEAREEIVTWLESEKLLEKTEEIDQNIGTAERTGGTIEPLPKLQWFVNVNKEFVLENSQLEGIAPGSTTTLKEIMRQVVASGQTVITPEQFAKRYTHWIENLRDWCISRQIWFGHQIPVWYKGEDVQVSKDSPGEGWEQDSDTLDTWFSSGLWPFTTLGWPGQTKDLATYYPTSVMDPGYEILFLWVSRMILFGGLLTGNVPFKTALIHGIVRDKQGRKFSKSSGVGGNPLDVIALHGADALRMSLISGVAMGNDPVFEIQQVKGYQHFANKIWNMVRFTLMNVENTELPEIRPEPITEADKDILEKLDKAIKEITEELENYRLHEAAQAIYQFSWREFADVYIEASKPQLDSSTSSESLRENTQKILLYCLINILKLLHPFMPFVTETIWQEIGQKKLLMIENWPQLR